MIDKIDKDKFLNDIIIASGTHPSMVFNVTIFGSIVYCGSKRFQL
jgi:hypothetical protein